MRAMNRTILALGAGCAALLAALPATALTQDPPVASESATSYREALDTLFLDMRALWGELDRFEVRRRYCLPPDAPMKQPDIDELAALEQRARDLNDRYARLRRGLNTFLANNPRIYAEFLADDIDPRSNRWWRRHDRNRDRMMAELARKKAALAAAPERRCGQPAAEPAQPLADPEPPFQPPAPPQLDPVTLTEPPARFCSEQEKYDFLMNVFFPAAHQANRNAQLAQGYAYDLSVLISDHTFDPAVRGPAEQAQAGWRPINAEQARIADVDIPAWRARIDATPVVDCNPAEPTEDILDEIGSVPTPPRTEVEILPTPQLDGSDERRVAQQQGFIDSLDGMVDARLGEAEAARLAGDCDRRNRILENLDEAISANTQGVYGRAYLPPRFVQGLRRRLAEALSRPCPPPPDQTGLTPAGPVGVFHVGTGELEADTQAGIGFQRPVGEPERFAGANADSIRMHTLGLVLFPLAYRHWLVSGSLLYGRGDESDQGVVEAGTGTSTGAVYSSLSLGDSSGWNIGDMGSSWAVDSRARIFHTKLKLTRTASGPVSWFLFMNYLHSERQYDGSISAEVFGETLSQSREQEVTDDLFGGGVGLQYETNLDNGVRIGGWGSAGLYHRRTELTARERNICPLCGPADQDFTLGFDEEDSGATWSAAVGAWIEAPLTDRVGIGAGIDATYIDEVGAVWNPQSGDQVFFDGLRTSLNTTDAVSYNFRIGARIRF